MVKFLKYYICLGFLINSLFANDEPITIQEGKYRVTGVSKVLRSQLDIYCDFPAGIFEGDEYCRHDENAQVGISKRYKRELFKWKKSIKSLLRVLPKSDDFRKEIVNRILADGKSSKNQIKRIFKKYNLSSQFNNNIWKHFKNSRAKRNKSKVWQAHCHMVTENYADELCPQIDLEELKEFTETVPFYPKKPRQKRICKKLIAKIVSEDDLLKIAAMKRELGKKCVNWCANFTDEERSAHCEGAIEENEEPERIHRCDGWWASKYQNLRNLSEEDVVKACSARTISNMNPMSSFESLYSGLMGGLSRVSEREIMSEGGTSFTARVISGLKNPFASTWRSYPTLLRIEALGGFLETGCLLSGEEIKAPGTCKMFSKGINEYQCSEIQKRKLNTDRKKDIISKAKDLVRLYERKKDLKKRYDKKISQCMEYKTKWRGVFGVIQSVLVKPAQLVTQRIIDKAECEEKHKPIYDQIKQIESLIVYMSKTEPILFSYSDSSKSIFHQKKLFHQRIKSLSKRNIDNFDKSYDGFKKAAKNKISASMRDICDPDKVPTRDLLQMESLTTSVKQRFPIFNGIEQQCLGRPDSTDIGGAFGIGTGLLCLAGSIGPQFFVVGGLCAGLFLGDSIVTAGEQKELLSFMRSSSLAGGRVSSHEDIARVEQNLESAKFDVMMGIALLPLDFIGGKQALKAITQGLKRVKSVPQRAFLMKKINERVAEISKISNPAKRKEQALIFLSELENSKSTFTRLLRDKSNPKYESYDENWLKFVRGRCL